MRLPRLEVARCAYWGMMVYSVSRRPLLIESYPRYDRIASRVRQTRSLTVKLCVRNCATHRRMIVTVDAHSSASIWF